MRFGETLPEDCKGKVGLGGAAGLSSPGASAPGDPGRGEGLLGRWMDPGECDNKGEVDPLVCGASFGDVLRSARGDFGGGIGFCLGEWSHLTTWF